MATPVIMPRQGQSVESCIIAKWHKNVGDTVSEGDVLFTYETDKATFEEEAKQSGTMLAVFFEEGDDVPCLTNVCVIGNEGEDASAFAPAGEEEESAEEAAPAASEPVANAAQPVAADNAVVADGDLKISPRARMAAQAQNVNPALVAGTGPHGRVIERDVMNARGAASTSAAYDAFAAADGAISGTGIGGRVRLDDLSGAPAAAAAPAPVQPEVEEVKHSNIRKVIARSMHASLSEGAQLTLNTSFDASALLAFRAKVKAQMERVGLANITLNDMILYAVAKTLPNHRELNAHYYDDKMVYFKSVNLGMAVDTERGLMVPTIFGADSMTLNEIALASKALAAECNKGTISPDLLKGGTFTISNLGSLGIETFTPVINPPQTGILGVNTIEKKVREVNGELRLYPSMSLSITFDHRALDGAPAARFVSDLARNLENFELLLAK